MIDYDVPFKYGNDIKYTGKERWCHGSFFVINTKSLRLFYDEEYKNSYDDWDYFSMVRASGAHQAYTDKACFQHKHGLTTKTLEDYKVQDKKNRALYREKWEQWPEDKFAKDFPEQMSIPYKKGFEL